MSLELEIELVLDPASEDDESEMRSFSGFIYYLAIGDVSAASLSSAYSILKFISRSYSALKASYEKPPDPMLDGSFKSESTS